MSLVALMLSIVINPNRYGPRSVQISEAQVRRAIAALTGDDSHQIQVWADVLWVYSIGDRPTLISKRKVLRTLGYF
ncbi:hypothetical protein K9N68_05830 [Kovacikia minuta CCNUW1]|uniref:hypothetical protein n=1 Tax=Kovacikia minuta TaxID=2931930 RepID=UPI001CCF8667|nr:hypothetical protein [Kovacikia minuta]UBF27464.1 hypothetical protein K9N68_05830 [Kovacikia minuta CCNUW1]